MGDGMTGGIIEYPDEKFERWSKRKTRVVHCKEEARRELKGKVLACWCKPKPCHGDILIELIDGPDEI